MVVGKNLREPVDRLVRWTLERNPRGRVQRDQIYLGFHAREELRQLPGGVHRVVHAGQQHVLEGDAAAALERETFARGDDIGDAELRIDRYQLAPNDVARRVERDRQVRHDRLARQPLERRQQTDR